jgi:hypothetical protein
VVITISTPKEATMYRRKRRILKSLVLGFAVAAFAAPAALGEPRGAGNNPDFWNVDPRTGGKIADTSPGIAPGDLADIYGGSAGDRSGYAGTSFDLSTLDPLIADAIRAHRNSLTFSPAVKGEQVKTMERPSFAPVSAPSVTASTDDGFQWVDAGLGAASTLALVLMGGAALMIRHQRRRLVAY